MPEPLELALAEPFEPEGELMRIRSIKPEFWRSDDVSALSREDRLLFIGLWSYVDDNGVGVDDYRQIAADLFALDEDQTEVRQFVRDGLARLSRRSLIARYEVGSKAYLFVTGWAHQRIDKPAKARYPQPSDWAPPPPTSGSGDPRETLATPSGVLDTGNKATNSANQTNSDEQDAHPNGLVVNGRGADDGTDQRFRRPSRDPRETLAPGTEEQGNRGTGDKDLLTADAASARDLGNRVPRSDLAGPVPTPSWSVEPRPDPTAAGTPDEPPAELVLLHSADPDPQPARDPEGPIGFEAFWDVCPRKIGKGKARSEYERAVKRGVPPERLRQRMEIFAQTHARRRTEQQFIPYPATWLHQCRWEDDHVAPDPAAENRGLGHGTTARKVANVMDAVEELERMEGIR